MTPACIPPALHPAPQIAGPDDAPATSRLYAIDLGRVLGIAAELADDAWWMWPPEDSQKPDDLERFTNILNAANVLKHALGAIGDLSPGAQSSGAAPVWAEYASGFRNHVPELWMFPVRPLLTHNFQTLANAAILLGTAARDRVTEVTPMVNAGLRNLFDGLVGLWGCVGKGHGSHMTLPNELLEFVMKQAKGMKELVDDLPFPPKGWDKVPAIDPRGFYVASSSAIAIA